MPLAPPAWSAGARAAPTSRSELALLEDPAHLLEEDVRGVARDGDRDRASAVPPDPEPERGGDADGGERVLLDRVERGPLQVEAAREEVERPAGAADRPLGRR